MAYNNDKVWTAAANDSDEIINRALRIIGEYDGGDAATATELTHARLALNSMIREWIADGVGLWLRQRCILILNPYRSNAEEIWRYSLGPTGTPGTTDDFHVFLDTELIEGIGDEAEPAAETTISLNETTGWIGYDKVVRAAPSASDVVGIELDNNQIFWDTVSSADTTEVVLNNGIPAGRTMPAGSRIYTYTTRAPRPHGIVYINRESKSGSTASVSLIGRRDYELLSLKGSSGTPTTAHFDPGLHATTPDSNFATLHVWPVDPGADWQKLVFVGEFYPDIIDATANENVQFPDEWMGALAWGLANELSDEYEIDLRRTQRIERMAEKKYANAAWASDREEASFFMAPDSYGRR